MKPKVHSKLVKLLIVFLCFTLVLEPAQESKAAAEIFVAVTIVIVGGIVIYVSWRWCKEHLPPPQPPPQQTNNPTALDPNSQYEVVYHPGTNESVTFPYLVEEFGIFDPYTNVQSYAYSSSDAMPKQTVTGTIQSGSSGGASNVFVLQFGLDNMSQPWILTGTNQPIGQVSNRQLVGTNGISVTLKGETFTFMVGNGNNEFGVNHSFEFSITNMMTTTNITDDDGDVVMIMQGSTNPIVVERNVNLSDLSGWVPIISTQAIPGEVFDLIDTNVPLQRAFYRSKLQSVPQSQ